MNQLNAKVLRKLKPEEEEIKLIKRNPIYLVLDRVLDTYNIGSLFRLADAIAAEKLYICGESDYPPSTRIHKSAVGTEEWVPWEKRDNAQDVVAELKEKGVQIISVEQDSRSIPYKSLKPTFPIAIVCGHESDGVSKEVLELSDIIVELPQLGINKSFNVWGSTAVIAYKALEELH
jgi:23S rRNA (guanosine2251-2'-O)-methyltransferase